jgi:hypothetical protein
MNAFLNAIRWWVFLPFVPVVLATLLEYWGQIFYHLRFHALLGVVGMLSVANAVLLLPYMALASAIFHPRLDLPFWFLALEFSVFAALLCLLLYGGNLFVVKRRKPRD